MSKKGKLFLVMTLHRAGSSATAGVMHRLGIHMGSRLLGPDQGNIKGHYENVGYLNENKRILRRTGYRWSQPNSKAKLRAYRIPASRARKLISRQARPVWGLKDPRTLLTYESWKPYFKEAAEITYVFVHRPFEDSVRSLARRDQITLSSARRILLPYLRSFKYYRRKLGANPKQVIDVYFEKMLKDPQPVVREFNRRLGKKPNANLKAVKKFLNPNLKHF